MDITQLHMENIVRIGKIFESEQRRDILEVLLNSKKPLTIIEIQRKCKIPNYKNTFNNLKMLEENGFVTIDKKRKHIEGIKVYTEPQIVLKAIALPITKELQSIEELFNSYIRDDFGKPTIKKVEETENKMRVIRKKFPVKP